MKRRSVACVNYIGLILYFITPLFGNEYIGMCGNPSCSVLISIGTTTMKYYTVEQHKLSFNPGEHVEVYIKDFGPKRDLWGVMKKGQKGFISKQFIRETRVRIKELVPAVASELKQTYLQGIQSLHVTAPSSTFPKGKTFASNSNIQISSLETVHHLSPGIPNSMAYHSSPPLSQGPYSQSLGAASTLNSDAAHVQGLNEDTMMNMGKDAQITSSRFLPGTPISSILSHSVEVVESSFLTTVEPSLKVVDPNSSPILVNSIHLSSDLSQRTNVHSHSMADDTDKTLAMLKERGYADEAYNYVDISDPSDNQNSEYVSNTNIDRLKPHSPGYKQKMYLSSSILQSSETSDHRLSQQTPAENTDSSSSNSVEKTNSIKSKVSDLPFSLLNQLPGENDVKQQEHVISPDMFSTGISNNQRSNSDFTNALPSQAGDSNPLQMGQTDLYIDSSLLENIYTSEMPSELSETITSEGYNGIHLAVHKESHQKINIVEQGHVTSPDVFTVHTNSQKHNLESTQTHTPQIDKSNRLQISQTKFHVESFLRETVNTDEISPVIVTSESSSSEIELNMHKESHHRETTCTVGHWYATSSIMFNTGTNDFKNNLVSMQTHSTQIVESVSSKSTINTKIPTEYINGISNYSSFKNVSSENEILLENKSEHLPSDHPHKSQVSPDENITNDFHSDASNGFTNIHQEKNNVPNVETSHDDEKEPYQARQLKGEYRTTENENSNHQVTFEEDIMHEHTYSFLSNAFKTLQLFVDTVIMWFPEPLYSIVNDLDTKRMQARATVFTALCAIPCLFLILGTVYLKENKKEKKILVQLMTAEKRLHMLSAEKIILEDKVIVAESEFQLLRSKCEEEKSIIAQLEEELLQLKVHNKDVVFELDNSLEEINILKSKLDEYLQEVSSLQQEKENLENEVDKLANHLKEEENSVCNLTNLLEENIKIIDHLHKEKEDYVQSEKEYEEKVMHLQQNCSQLLQEAEIWNERVNDLTKRLNEETGKGEELEKDVKLRADEIESLKHVIQSLQPFEDLNSSPEGEDQTKEEKLQSLLDASSVQVKLQREENEKKVLLEKLSATQNKALEMEVGLLEAKAEIDKLKLNYNQALQDKTEAQTKLDVLSHYFKDKEIQLQKELGAQEAVRQKKEEDVSSAERRICLIEQENASYKYQVASMKQEMEETERSLKNQIASHEKKAHENWLVARAAERKLEEMKQEIMQLRQRLTLLEREQNWISSPREELLRPVPKRLAIPRTETESTQDTDSSMESFHSKREHVPVMLPTDRPLPPLPPPPPLGPFLPHPMEPPIVPPFHPPIWHLPSSMDFKKMPPDPAMLRESTPPRGRMWDEQESSSSSPPRLDMRGSSNSTPPHSLPHFHDIPPQPPRAFFPPPMYRPKFPMQPQRKEHLPQMFDAPQDEMNMHRGNHS